MRKALFLGMIAALGAAVLLAQDITAWINGARAANRLWPSPISAVPAPRSRTCPPSIPPCSPTCRAPASSICSPIAFPAQQSPAPDRPAAREDNNQGIRPRRLCRLPAQRLASGFRLHRRTERCARPLRLCLRHAPAESHRRSSGSSATRGRSIRPAPPAAHEFANDIIQKFGGSASLLGSRIYFVSNRSGSDEIWVMDWDGNNQKQLTGLSRFRHARRFPDGTRVAFTSWAKAPPAS